MPPKKKAAERSEEMEAGRETETDFSISSPASTASSGSCMSLTADQLQQILATNQKAMLEASHQSMVALLATLSPPSASVPATPRIIPVKVPKWTDEEIPFEYFNKLEKALKHNGVENSAWGHLLPVYFAGRAQAAFAQVDQEALDDYDVVKATLLESLGDTPASADRKWWSLSRQPGEEAGSFYLRVRATGIRRLHGLATREEILEQIVLSRFLSLLPSDCYSSVVSRQPKNGLEAARLTQEFEETRSFSRRSHSWKQDPNRHPSQLHGGREQNFVSGSGGGDIGAVVSSGGGPQNNFVAGTGQSSDGSSSQESMGVRPVGRFVSERKQVTCHGCGELGHIRPNCPNRIRRIIDKDAVPGCTIDGFLVGVAVKGLKVDTGSGRTLVHKDYIPGAAYTGKTVVLDSWRGGQRSRHRLARITIKVGDVEELAEVVVVDTLDCPALLGNNLGSELTVKLISLLLEDAQAAELNC